MQKSTAALLILCGGSCMSFVGLVMRLIGEADGFQILFYRSITLSLIVMLVACLKRRCGPVSFLKALDRNDMAMGAALALAFSTYVFAMLTTSVASTLFILTATPFLSALIAWAWIQEHPSRRTWIAMVMAALGVLIMVGDGLSSGRWLGAVFAIISAVMFALMLVLARRSRKPDVLGGTFLGGIFAILLGGGVALLLGSGLAVSGWDMGLSLFMGMFTIGLGIALVTWGTPFVPAAEVSILVLIESVLGPIWVWVFVSERMTTAEIAGGVIVFLSILYMSAPEIGRGKRARSSG